MNTEYLNGSDLLVNVGSEAVGHSSTCTISLTSETKDRAVKPLASASSSASMWKEKGVTGLAINIKADGLTVVKETENGFMEVAPDWGKGSAVDVEVYLRGQKEKPIIKGKFIISSMEITGPAQDDTTYSITLDNSGEPDIYPGKEEAAA